MTRRPVKTTDGRTVYLDEDGKYYAEPEPEEEGLRSLDENPRIHHPNREPEGHWDWAEDENGNKYPFPRLAER